MISRSLCFEWFSVLFTIIIQVQLYQQQQHTNTMRNVRDIAKLKSPYTTERIFIFNFITHRMYSAFMYLRVFVCPRKNHHTYIYRWDVKESKLVN